MRGEQSVLCASSVSLNASEGFGAVGHQLAQEAAGSADGWASGAAFPAEKLPWHDAAERRWLKDGGGLPSNGDWSIPRKGADTLFELRQRLQGLALEWDLLRRLQLRVSRLLVCESEGVPPPEDCKLSLFSEQEVGQMRVVVADFVRARGFEGKVGADPGQPYHLDLWEDLARVLDDEDCQLFAFLRGRINTGFFDPIDPSGVWRPTRKRRRSASLQLQWCDGNWLTAEQEPETAQRIIESDVKKGLAERWHGTFEDARAEWPQGVAKGKLGLAKQMGKDDRLTGDCTVAGVNPGCFFPEDAENPTPAELSDALSSNSADVGAPRLAQFSLDIAGAHKTLRVRKYDQGLQFFEVAGVLYRWLVCHFGAAYSAWWWSRCGAMIMRLIHRLVWRYHFGFCFVDDYEVMVPAEGVWLDACTVIMALTAIGVPLSWAKLRVSLDELKYIGLQVHSFRRCLSLPEDKLAKARNFLATLVPGSRIKRKELEKGTCFLMWIAGVARFLKPWLSAFFNNLSRPAVASHKLNAVELREVADSLGKDLVVREACISGRVKAGWRVLKVGRFQARSVSDLLQPPLSEGFATVEFSSTSSVKTCVSEECGMAAKLWLHSLRGFPLLRDCSAPEPLPGAGAADAWAEGSGAGIGGWWSPKADPSLRDIWWFQLDIDPLSLPDMFAISQQAGSDISFYEALAQVVLLEARLKATCARFSAVVSVKHFCDNNGVVGGNLKMFSTKKPFCFALQLLSYVCTRRGASARILHLDGEANEWADKLSRSREYPDFTRQLDSLKEVKVDLKYLFREAWGDMIDRRVVKKGHSMRPFPLLDKVRMLIGEAAPPRLKFGACCWSGGQWLKSGLFWTALQSWDLQH